MRIAILSAAKSIHTVRWVNSLAECGHAVALYSLPDHWIPGEVFSPRAEVHYLRRGSAAGYWLCGRELAALLVRFHPDVLSAHYATGYGTLARRCGFHPLLLSVWGSDVYEFPYEGCIHAQILRRNIENATAVASTSHAMARQVGRVCPGEKPFFITPFGVDTSVFSPRADACPAGNGGFTVGTVKSLEPKYGIDDLVRAFALFHRRLEGEGRMMPDGVRLEIYGGGSQMESLRRLADALGIGGVTGFRGPVPHGRVPAVLRSFDIFCAPSVSDSESFGVAAVEAMACGVPVLVSDADGFREVVRDNETGLIVARRDPRLLADRMARLAGDPGLRRRLGAAARAHVQREYEWSRCVTAMEDALASAIALGGGAGA